MTARCQFSNPIEIYCDNTLVIFHYKNKRSSGSKHIEIKYLIIRDKTKNGHTIIKYISVEATIVDTLTKDLAPKFFNMHVVKMDVLSSSDTLG